MSDRLIQSQKRLHDSLFELYMQGGLALFQAGTRGLKRELIIDLETSGLNCDSPAWSNLPGRWSIQLNHKRAFSA